MEAIYMQLPHIRSHDNHTHLKPVERIRLARSWINHCGMRCRRAPVPNTHATNISPTTLHTPYEPMHTHTLCYVYVYVVE